MGLGTPQTFGGGGWKRGSKGCKLSFLLWVPENGSEGQSYVSQSECSGKGLLLVEVVPHSSRPHHTAGGEPSALGLGARECAGTRAVGFLTFWRVTFGWRSVWPVSQAPTCCLSGSPRSGGKNLATQPPQRSLAGLSMLNNKNNNPNGVSRSHESPPPCFARTPLSRHR